MANNNQNFNSKIPNAMNVEFGNETDVNQIRQQIQQAEANKKTSFWFKEHVERRIRKRD